MVICDSVNRLSTGVPIIIPLLLETILGCEAKTGLPMGSMHALSKTILHQGVL